jgi:hypothetical protein
VDVIDIHVQNVERLYIQRNSYTHYSVSRKVKCANLHAQKRRLQPEAPRRRVQSLQLCELQQYRLSVTFGCSGLKTRSCVLPLLPISSHPPAMMIYEPPTARHLPLTFCHIVVCVFRAGHVQTAALCWKAQNVLCLTYLLTYSLTHSMVQDIIWKADCHSACQKISCFLMEPGGSLPCSNKPATGLYPEPAETSSPHPSLSP